MITLCGLISALAAAGLVNFSDFREEKHNQYLSAAAFLHFLYSIFDNLDGKQARRLGLASRSGELLDHSVDSLISSIGFISFAKILAPNSPIVGPRLPTLLLAPQMCSFTAHWVHEVTGTMLLGPVSEFGVDELNALVVPFIYCSRALSLPSGDFLGGILFDRPSRLLSLFSHLIGSSIEIKNEPPAASPTLNMNENVNDALIVARASDAVTTAIAHQTLTDGEVGLFLMCAGMLASIPYVLYKTCKYRTPMLYFWCLLWTPMLVHCLLSLLLPLDPLDASFVHTLFTIDVIATRRPGRSDDLRNNSGLWSGFRQMCNRLWLSAAAHVHNASLFLAIALLLLNFYRWLIIYHLLGHCVGVK